MRARRCHAQEWENKNDREYFASGAERSCVDPVWRASLAAETAAIDRMAAAVVTQDMTTFFQSIDLAMLEKRAEVLDFPLCLVRLAIAQYTAQR